MNDFIKNIFLFDKDHPLIFTRLWFWLFFAVIYAGYSIIYKKEKPRNAYLFIVSLFFYYKTSGIFFLLLIFSTIVDFFIGKAVYHSDKNLKRKLLVALSVSVNLSVLIYYKYSAFFTESFNYLFGIHLEPVDLLAKWTNQFAGTHFTIDKIILPVGISFFTFQTISYTIDVFRKKIKPVTNIIDFGFYVSFFPQLVAGPIVRASEFVPQLYKKYNITKAEFGMAIFMILNGLLKKLVIADYIAVNFVDRVFSNPMTYGGFENLMALYGYSVQVYSDFSGYTDVAIGVALLIGFRLPINFNSPYKALHTGEFWKRWHISLSSWLKDYLYIPLGGNRKGKA
ncbi:MAG: MBOAT family protein, partial [Bacteroidales bacterium]|nr:MBOAT family protein [Bacteroidales bacterium]